MLKTFDSKKVLLEISQAFYLFPESEGNRGYSAINNIDVKTIENRAPYLFERFKNEIEGNPNIHLIFFRPSKEKISSIVIPKNCWFGGPVFNGNSDKISPGILYSSDEVSEVPYNCVAEQILFFATAESSFFLGVEGA